MNFELLGRSAPLNKDDAAFVYYQSEEHLLTNGDASVDRYDVRLLLPEQEPRKLCPRQTDPHTTLDVSEKLLDEERYRDLHEEPGDETAAPTESARELAPEESFQPRFAVPERLEKHVPLSERQHQLIVKTAQFVAAEGGQAEVVLKVQQGENAKFGFLFEEHLHFPYYKWLCQDPTVVDQVQASVVEGVSGKARTSEKETPLAAAKQSPTYGRTGTDAQEPKANLTRGSDLRLLDVTQGKRDIDRPKESQQMAARQKKTPARQIATDPGPAAKDRTHVKKKRRFQDAPLPDREAEEMLASNPKKPKETKPPPTEQDLKKARIRQVLRRKQQEWMRHIHTREKDTKTVTDHKKAFADDDDDF